VPVIVVVAYDIVDDARREDVASLLSGYGPRVQLSVFECQVDSQTALQALRADLRALIDPLEDQIRLYPTTSQTFSQRYNHRSPHRRGAQRLLDRPMTPLPHGNLATSSPRTVLPNHCPKRLGARKLRFRSSASLLLAPETINMITPRSPSQGARKPSHHRWSDPPSFDYCHYA